MSLTPLTIANILRDKSEEIVFLMWTSKYSGIVEQAIVHPKYATSRAGHGALPDSAEILDEASGTPYIGQWPRCLMLFDVVWCIGEVLKQLFAERATYNVRLGLAVVSRTTVEGTITTKCLLEAAGKVVDCRCSHCDELLLFLLATAHACSVSIDVEWKHNSQSLWTVKAYIRCDEGK